MRLCINFLTDSLTAFFGSLLGEPVPGAPLPQVILGGGVVIGEFLLLFCLIGLLGYRMRMPLPPEEGEDGREDEGGDPQGGGATEDAAPEPQATRENTETEGETPPPKA